MFFKKGVLKNFSNFTGKHLCWSLLFNKVAFLRPGVFQQGRFPVKFVKFGKNTFFYRTLLVAASDLKNKTNSLNTKFPSFPSFRFQYKGQNRIYLFIYLNFMLTNIQKPQSQCAVKNAALYEFI